MGRVVHRALVVDGRVMPTSPLTVCAQPGCPIRVPRGYCATHARTSPRNHRGVPRQQREHGTAYDRLAREMRGQPCSLRFTGCTGYATGADLIVPRSQGGRAEPSNARPACGHCQSVQGGRMRGSQPWHGRELVVLMGPPGSGKSTYASRFPLVATTDALRAMRAPSVDDVDAAYSAAFATVASALRANRRVVLDTPASSPWLRRRALSLARAYRATAHLVVFTTPLDVCLARQSDRDCPVPESVVRSSHAAIQAQLDGLADEGWDSITGRGGEKSPWGATTGTARQPRSYAEGLFRTRPAGDRHG